MFENNLLIIILTIQKLVFFSLLLLFTQCYFSCFDGTDYSATQVWKVFTFFKNVSTILKEWRPVRAQHKQCTTFLQISYTTVSSSWMQFTVFPKMQYLTINRGELMTAKILFYPTAFWKVEHHRFRIRPFVSERQRTLVKKALRLPLTPHYVHESLCDLRTQSTFISPSACIHQLQINICN